MITIYVDKRSDLTYTKDYPMTDGCEFYRIRTVCNCPVPHNHRSGLLVIDKSDSVQICQMQIMQERRRIMKTKVILSEKATAELAFVQECGEEWKYGHSYLIYG